MRKTPKKKKAAKKPTKYPDQFPRQVFIKWDGDETPWLEAYEHIESLEEGDVVAVYERREVRIVNVTYALEKPHGQ